MPPAPVSPSKLPRLTSWWLIALALSALVFVLAPQQIPVSIYKLNLISLAAVVAYWVDRKVYPYARPSIKALECLRAVERVELTEEDWRRGYILTDKGEQVPVEQVIAATFGPSDPAPLYFMLGCMLRRAIIIAAAMIAISLGG